MKKFPSEEMLVKDRRRREMLPRPSSEEARTGTRETEGERERERERERNLEGLSESTPLSPSLPELLRSRAGT
ncbi:unnamed protein product [Spirodela intermedia]|uniref:Uncharacterized protein n=1 Tax=Spirodela intermedia TaxID=51605 RepID=A0A7I8JGQ5_SPIIN|nr:unnamed protein product [Spirodela intermedia]CAA6668723.1 unnamed protein product [Spirodela intermedia]